MVILHILRGGGKLCGDIAQVGTLPLYPKVYDK